MISAKEGHDFIIRIDGDGQHDPADLQTILRTLVEDDADLVIGSRYCNGCDFDHSGMRRIGTRLLSWLVSRLTGYEVTDVTCGFRGYSRRAIEAFAEEYPDDFPEVEALMISHQRGLKAEEVPVKALQREHGESSIRPTTAIYYMSMATLAILVNKLRELLGAGPGYDS
jgi:glycosyltransferase involved in cell wall biosynthesis